MFFLDLSLIFSSTFSLVGLNAAITYSRAWRIQGAAPKVAHSHTRPILVMWFSGLPTKRNTHMLELRTFHPFTHETRTSFDWESITGLKISHWWSVYSQLRIVHREIRL